MAGDLYSDLGISVGDLVRIRRGGSEIEGIVMPKHAFSDPDIVVLKLRNGYNVGVRVDSSSRIEVVRRSAVRPASTGASAQVPPSLRPDLPKIMVIGTGGTIASKVEYETGAVKPAMSAGELMELIPEISEIASIEVESVYNILSENMRPEYWEVIAERIYRYMVDESYSGVVVTHGTDTMGYTASAIAFAIRDMPKPVVFVGSQRSSDRPSTDAALNFISALITASQAPFAESVVAMHAETSDREVAVHRGVKVRKMHTSRRDTFQSINASPLAYVDPVSRRIRVVSERFMPRDSGRSPSLANRFDRRVALLYSYPGFDPELIDFLVDKGYRGIVIAGTGFGHVPEYAVASLKRASDSGVLVAVASQTLFGAVNLRVYTTGREMLKAGVIPCGDMLPETAYVKLSWALGNSRDLDEARGLMVRDIAFEYEPRIIDSYYPRWS